VERLREWLKNAKKVLLAFDEVMKMPRNKITRDASVHRFKFTVEAVWKLAQRHLSVVEGISVVSPKKVFRECLLAKLLSADETSLALEMVDSGNLTSHTYDEQLVDKIYGNLASYLELMKFLVANVGSNLR